MIFDTDVLIWAARGNVPAVRLIESESDRELSVVSLMELLRGARSKMEVRNTRQFLLRLGITVVPLSASIGSTAAGLIELHALAHGIHVSDALIAATAIETGQVLCTGNVRHFRPIRGLSLTAFRVSA